MGKLALGLLLLAAAGMTGMVLWERGERLRCGRRLVRELEQNARKQAERYPPRERYGRDGYIPDRDRSDRDRPGRAKPGR